MALNSATYTSNQTPWVRPADMDISQPFQLELIGKPGAGEPGGVSLGGQGAGGGEYAQWSSIIVADFSATSITFVAGSAGYVLFTDDVGNNYISGNGQDGADGGLGGNIAGGSDIAPTIANAGGAGRSRGTTSGGGGGGNATSGGTGANGTAGSVATGGAGGLDGSGASGGGAGGNVGAPGVNGVNGGGGGGGTTHVGGSGLPVAKAVVTYTVASVNAGIDQTIASGDTATMAGTSGGGTLQWTSTGTGTFSDNTVTAVYTPSEYDIAKGLVVLALTNTDGGGTLTYDEMLLTITGGARTGPTVIAASQSTWIDASQPVLSHLSAESPVCGSAGGGLGKRPILAFDLTGLSGTVSSAILTRFVSATNGISGATFWGYRLLRRVVGFFGADVDPNSATWIRCNGNTPTNWAAQGADSTVSDYFAASPAVVVPSETPSTAGNQLLATDITTLIQAAINGGLTNCCIMPVHQDESFNVSYTFAGAANGTTANRPFLTVAMSIAPTVTSGAATGIGATVANLAGNVTDDGGNLVTETFFVFSKTSVNNDPIAGGSGVTKVSVGTGSGPFTKYQVSFEVGVQYSFKAAATTASGTSYSAVRAFTTFGNTITTNAAFNITSTGARLGGTLADPVSDPDFGVSTVDLYYSLTTTNSDPKEGGTGVTKVNITNGIVGNGSLSVNVTGLTSGLQYSYNIGATEDSSTVIAYGQPHSFTTLSSNPPKTRSRPIRIQRIIRTKGRPVT